jgi:methylenetetrahydrofolate dehydrogenase (NADP+)/methenyltetrahydrofolate cyclohydrolase
MTILINGANLASEILESAAKSCDQFTSIAGRKPGLATVLVGDDPASRTYVRMKTNRARGVGIDAQLHLMPAETTTADLCTLMRQLSEDPLIDGILLQHPVPAGIDEREAFELIPFEKDVDGVTMRSFAAVSFGLPAYASATPGAIMRLLAAYGIDPRGKLAVVVGRSPILGKPLGMMLLSQDATVMYCHSKTIGLPDLVGLGDIVVAAVGQPELIRGDWIKQGAVVMDAGYNPGNIGDVEFETAEKRASYITPVPGGVGPMTIAVLLDQTVDAALRRVGITEAANDR